MEVRKLWCIVCIIVKKSKRKCGVFMVTAVNKEGCQKCQSNYSSMIKTVRFRNLPFSLSLSTNNHKYTDRLRKHQESSNEITESWGCICDVSGTIWKDGTVHKLEWIYWLCQKTRAHQLVFDRSYHRRRGSGQVQIFGQARSLWKGDTVEVGQCKSAWWLMFELVLLLLLLLLLSLLFYLDFI